MDFMETEGRLEHAELQIVVTRADGTVEDLGVVAEYQYEHNRLKRIWQQIAGRNNGPTARKRG